jgi:hypothetical protein
MLTINIANLLGRPIGWIQFIQVIFTRNLPSFPAYEQNPRFFAEVVWIKPIKNHPFDLFFHGWISL